jgi:hypothetical protein
MEAQHSIPLPSQSSWPATGELYLFILSTKVGIFKFKSSALSPKICINICVCVCVGGEGRNPGILSLGTAFGWHKSLSFHLLLAHTTWWGACMKMDWCSSEICTPYLNMHSFMKCFEICREHLTWEENRTQRSVTEPPPHPLHHQRTTEDPNLACNTNIRDLLWQCSGQCRCKCRTI